MIVTLLPALLIVTGGAGFVAVLRGLSRMGDVMAGGIGSTMGRLRWAALAALMAGAGLSGCKTNNVESAWQLIQQQQQEQALARQKEDEAENKRRPAEPELMLSMIAEAQRQERYFASLAYIDAFQQQFGNDPRVGPMRAEALRQTGRPPPASRRTGPCWARRRPPTVGTGWA